MENQQFDCMKRQNLLYVFLLCVLPAFSVQLVVCPLTGEEMSRELASIGKLVYRADSLYIYDCLGIELYKEQLVKVRAVRYGDEVSSSVSEVRTDGPVRVYPNPTTAMLIVERVQGDEVCLYNYSGQRMKSVHPTEGKATMDMSDVPAGTYILLCGGESFKVIKE